MRLLEAKLLAIKHGLRCVPVPSSMPCNAKAMVWWGVPATLCLLNFALVRSSNFILNVKIDAMPSDFGAYSRAKHKPNVVVLSEL